MEEDGNSYSESWKKMVITDKGNKSRPLATSTSSTFSRVTIGLPVAPTRTHKDPAESLQLRHASLIYDSDFDYQSLSIKYPGVKPVAHH